MIETHRLNNTLEAFLYPIDILNAFFSFWVKLTSPIHLDLKTLSKPRVNQQKVVKIIDET